MKPQIIDKKKFSIKLQTLLAVLGSSNIFIGFIINKLLKTKKQSALYIMAT
jgi:hypothetical protein